RSPQHNNKFVPSSSSNPFDSDDDGEKASKTKYKSDFRDSGGPESQSVQDLENHAVHRAEETTKSVNECLKIAEEMREDATKTLVTLHQQGEQITRAHTVAADIDQDLSRSEKLLGSLGGIFSKTWKPKKSHPIKGPIMTTTTTTTITDDPLHRRGNHLEQRERLGLTRKSKLVPDDEQQRPTNALQKVEVERAKQDDALGDLSDVLGELKAMAIDMGTEIERHNKALDRFEDDADELHHRVKGASQRTRRLLGK
ncbi:hypothetical protein M569_09573, partial [Genlisea aurea]